MHLTMTFDLELVQNSFKEIKQPYLFLGSLKKFLAI